MPYISWQIAGKNWNLLWHSGKHNWNDIQYTWYIDSIDLNGSSEYQTQSFSLYKKTLVYESLQQKGWVKSILSKGTSFCIISGSSGNPFGNEALGKRGNYAIWQV